MISPRAGDVRNAALCGLATLVALVVVWPISGLSFNDDWSFAFTAKRLAETGHVLYNGWSSPSVIGQSYYALPWVRLFGFSFNVLRLSTAPLAIASVVLTYVLARRAGLDAGGATFAAAALLACPLFLPLATSFMTDVPGLFCILASTYALVRCRAARTGTALAWLAVGVAVAAVGGSSRQIVWVAPLAVLPYVAWLRRADRGLAVTFVLAWASTFAAAAAIQHWFNAQPFALPEPSITSELARAARRPVPVVLRFLAVLLTTLLLLLPAMAVVARRQPAAAGRAASAAGVVAFAVVMIHPIRTAAPWTGNILTPGGIFTVGQLAGHAPTVLFRPVRAALTAAVVASAVLLIASCGRAASGDPGRAWRAATSFILRPPPERSAGPAVLLVGGSYLSLLLTRCVLDISYDRHLLSVVPCFTIPLLLLGLPAGAEGRRARVPGVAWAVLAAVGLFAVAATQEELARARAIVAAADRLRVAGIPREAINAGFEYDSWTQLLDSGHINEPRIVNPPGAYRPGLGQRPSLNFRYTVEYEPTFEGVPSPFGVVSYWSWLPPFQRRLRVDRFLSEADRGVGARPRPATATRPAAR